MFRANIPGKLKPGLHHKRLQFIVGTQFQLVENQLVKLGFGVKSIVEPKTSGHLQSGRKLGGHLPIDTGVDGAARNGGVGHEGYFPIIAIRLEFLKLFKRRQSKSGVSGRIHGVVKPTIYLAAIQRLGVRILQVDTKRELRFVGIIVQVINELHYVIREAFLRKAVATHLNIGRPTDPIDGRGHIFDQVPGNVSGGQLVAGAALLVGIQVLHLQFVGNARADGGAQRGQQTVINVVIVAV